MLATYVNDRVTPYTFADAAGAMKWALRNEIGSDPSRECLALALAKCALETWRWRAIHQHNWGNIKAGASYAGQYCCFELNEVLSGKVVWFSPRGRLDRKGGKVVAEPYEDPPGHPQTRMRAHENVFTGAEAYVNFMVRGAGGRFVHAFNFMRVGNAAGMVHEMKLKRYFTADESRYAAGVISIQREFLGRLDGLSPPTVEFSDEEYEAFRTFRNEELLASFIEDEYERIHHDPTLHGAAAALEYERDTEPPPEPNS